MLYCKSAVGGLTAATYLNIGLIYLNPKVSCWSFKADGRRARRGLYA
jgi:hypothetical protein